MCDIAKWAISVSLLVPPRRFLAIAGRVTNSAKPLPDQHTGPAAISLAGLFRFLHSRTTSRFESASLWRDAKEVH
jgi:hypothetical protein